MNDNCHIKDWKTASYLESGNELQRKAYDIISRFSILEDLSLYQPVVTGTIPIGVDVPGSDLDIICKAENLKELQIKIRSLYGMFEDFADHIYKDRYVACFNIDGLEIEIFGQDIPTEQQYAYRHMLIEDRILSQRDELFRNEIIRLKSSGMKTEPAFALLLGLKNNPYEALLELEGLTDDELKLFFIDK